MAISKVLLTGATGFIALHVLKQLLEDPEYVVVGTVRSQEKADKLISDFEKEYPSLDVSEKKLTFEIVPDIAVPDAFDETIKKHSDLDFVLHTASPFHYHFKDSYKDMLSPAVNGTIGILKSVKKYGPNVKHVVVTSSFAAILNSSKLSDPTFTFDESCWNPLTWQEAKNDPYLPYTYSKIAAERGAWDFIKTEKPGFSLSTVAPPYVFGPQVFKSAWEHSEWNTSNEALRSTFKTPLDYTEPQKDFLFIAVDVRDVAKLHIIAIKKRESAAGNRWLAVSGVFSSQAALDFIHEKEPQRSETIGIGKPGSGPELESTFCKFNNEKTKRESGIEFIPLTNTALDIFKQIKSLSVNVL